MAALSLISRSLLSTANIEPSRPRANCPTRVESLSLGLRHLGCSQRASEWLEQTSSSSESNLPESIFFICRSSLVVHYPSVRPTWTKQTIQKRRRSNFHIDWISMLLIDNNNINISIYKHTHVHNWICLRGAWTIIMMSRWSQSTNIIIIWMICIWFDLLAWLVVVDYSNSYCLYGVRYSRRLSGITLTGSLHCAEVWLKHTAI